MNLELIKYHKKQKGDEYEELVAQYYANQGYIVIKNGFIAEKNDKGVDLIAIAPLEIQLEDEIIYRYEVLLIQCKCFEGFGSCIGSTEESIEGTIVSHSAEKIFEAMEKFNR